MITRITRLVPYAALLFSFWTIPAYAQNEGFGALGEQAVGLEKENHEEQMERAKTSVDRVAGEAIPGKTVIRHPFYEGVEPEKVNKAIEYDKAVIENERTYQQCLQYEIVGKCLSNVDGKVEITPFVRYWGPWQKGEEVPEPFRTTYLPKEQVKEEKRKVIEEDPKYYEDFIKTVIEQQQNFSRQISIARVNQKRVAEGEDELPIEPAPTPDQRYIDAARAVVEGIDNTHFGEASMAQDGFVFNEYHLFPAISSIYTDMIPPMPPPPEVDPPYFCHTQKMVGTWLSEFQGNNVFSRTSEASQADFAAEMNIIRTDPLNCLGFNASSGYTPPQLAGLALTSSASPCQGINMGNWVPVLNKMNLQYQTTAAAVGLVRSRIANRRDRMSFYDINPFEDRVQWIQNDRMDGISDPGDEDDPEKRRSDPEERPGGPDGTVITKKCVKLSKFVLDYDKNRGRGNLKISHLADAAKGRDHWNVLAHWRKIRCCPKGGVPIYAAPPEQPILILE